MGITTKKFHQPPNAPFYLGRHIEHDDRSRNFSYEAEPKKHKNKTHRIVRKVLDQGQLGACTGFAIAQCFNTSHFRSVRKDVNGGTLYNWNADALYSMATELDQFRGEWPPDDTGSSGLGAAKAAAQYGFIERYEHVFSFEQFLNAIVLQPLIVGTGWTNSMFNPDSKGLVSPQYPLGTYIAGGHEYLCRGVDFKHEILRFRNSWGVEWGVKGDFYMTFYDFSKLLAAQGDATVPILP